MFRRVVVVVLSATASLSAAASAPAAQKAITGRLSKPGYTVIAVGYDGSAASSAKRAFRIVPRSSRVTLQLRDPHGHYAGPVVVGGSGTQSVLGIRAGARLGTVRVLSGYAKARVAKRFLDRRRVAQARKGVPLGNGRNFGFVRSTKSGPPGDQDLDGVPDILDVDINGNLVLNNADRRGSRRAHAAQDQGAKPPTFNLFSQIGASLDQSINANASAVTDPQIDALVQGSTQPPYQPPGLMIDLTVLPGDETQLDCGGLTYCSKGGTGLIGDTSKGAPEAGASFPDCCDSDANGFGTMSGRTGPMGQTEMFLYPKATSTQIKTGDVLIERPTSGGTTTEAPGTLNFVFNTTPALVSWTSTGGDAAQITYPVRRGTPQDPGDPGTQDNPFVVHAGSDGNVQVTMTFWRPQRRAIAGAGEGDGFVDVGHLLWQSRLVDQSGVVDCKEGLSTTDPNLAPSGDPSFAGFTDTFADTPANPQNTLSYTLNFNACLNAGGKGSTFPSGSTTQVEIVARSPVGGDNSAQQVYFKRG